MPINDYYQEYGPIRRRRSQQGGPAPERPGPPPDSPPRRRPPRRRRSSPLASLLAALVAVAAALLVLPYTVTGLAFRERILPGVSVAGLDVGGATPAEADTALARRYADFLTRPLTLAYEERFWSPALADLGVNFTTTALAAEAFAVGRRGDPITRLLDLWAVWARGVDLSPRATVDKRVLQGYLLGLAPEVERPPENAALSIAAARVVGTPSTAGRQILADATAGEILTALAALEPGSVPLRTRELAPTIGDAALVSAQNSAQALLQSPIVLTRGEEQWVWGPDRLAELLRVRGTGDSLVVEVDEAQLTTAVERLSQLVDTGTAEPRLRFVGGQVQIVEAGRPGWRLQLREAAQAISETLRLSQPTTRTLALPVEELTPRVTPETLGELGIVELVGEGRSSFAGSAAYRITNIKAGAARMDGVLIAPDEEFSFNTQLGEVDAANGFVEGYAIIGNRTQLEWGGGVCQDSTTVFRAAFWAGLPITERHAHSFYISWYDRFGLGPYGDGQGMDAAIYTGVNDLKFVNDTGKWLLMQAEVDEVGQVLTVRLYGTKPNREVRLEGPVVANVVPAPSEPVYVNDPSRPRGTVYQSDVARSGRDITVYRVIVEDGVEVRREPFFTRFRAWPNVYVRGTG